MKNLIKVLASVAILFAATTDVAAKSKAELTSCDYKATIDCESCTKKVMATLPYRKGVKDVKVKLSEKIITVKYDGAKCSSEDIVASLKKIDIEAKPIVKK